MTNNHMKAEEARVGLLVRGMVSKQLYRISGIYVQAVPTERSDTIGLVYVEPINPRYPNLFPPNYCLSTMELEIACDHDFVLQADDIRECSKCGERR